MSDASLISVESGEIHAITKSRGFYIGRGAVSSDGMLQIESDRVSRRHAVIINDGERYYVYDDHSKNGTHVNNCLLDQGERKTIETGDVISFSGFDYMFKTNREPISQTANNSSLGTLEIIHGRQVMLIEFNEAEVSLYQIKMLVNNPSHGFLTLQYIKVSESYKLYYDLEGYMRLDHYLGAKRLENVQGITILHNILMGCLKADDLLLNSKNVYLKTNGIFIDPLSLKIQLLYLPNVCNNSNLYESLLNIIELMERQADEGVLTAMHEIKAALHDHCIGTEALSLLILNQETMQRQFHDSEKRVFAVEPLETSPVASISMERKEQLKSDFFNITLTAKQKLFIIQALLGGSAIGVYLAQLLSGIDYLGFLVLVIGLDLWLIRSFHLI